MVVVTKTYSQTVPKEDYISTKSVTGTLLDENGGVGIKGGAYLYYNDSCVILHIDGAKNKTIFFKIFKKYWNNEDKHIVITCYDSLMLAKYPDITELSKHIPDLVIHINYDGAITFQEGHTKSTTKKYVDIDCTFYNKGLKVGFGFDAKSDKLNIPIIRKKYSKYIIG
jgi:hypothetical protein